MNGGLRFRVLLRCKSIIYTDYKYDLLCQYLIK